MRGLLLRPCPGLRRVRVRFPTACAVGYWLAPYGLNRIKLSAAGFQLSACAAGNLRAGFHPGAFSCFFLLTAIATCNMIIADCDMKLGEKLRYLREVDGALRGLDRELSQQEVARLVQKELGKSISQSYLSQIESGARPHLTNSTRMLLARFFKVHPGYLVDDPEGYQNELVSELGAIEDKLDLWLVSGAERFSRDPELHRSLLAIARHADSRMCVVLLGEILENAGLAERLIEVLRAPAAASGRKQRRRS